MPAKPLRSVPPAPLATLGTIARPVCWDIICKPEFAALVRQSALTVTRVRRRLSVQCVPLGILAQLAQRAALAIILIQAAALLAATSM